MMLVLTEEKTLVNITSLEEISPSCFSESGLELESVCCYFVNFRIIRSFAAKDLISCSCL